MGFKIVKSSNNIGIDARMSSHFPRKEPPFFITHEGQDLEGRLHVDGAGDRMEDLECPEEYFRHGALLQCSLQS